MRFSTLLILASIVMQAPFAHGQDFPIDEAIAADRDRLLQIQTNLNAIGFNAGRPDGVFGNGSKRAFQGFLDKFGLAALDAASEDRLAAIAAAYTTPPWELSRAVSTLYLRDTTFQRSSWDVRQAGVGCEDGDCRVFNGLAAAGDLTGDGLPELVYLTGMMNSNWDQTKQPGRIIIMTPTVKGKYEELPVTMADGKPLARTYIVRGTIEDFNGDGIGDLFLTASGYDHPPYPGEQDVLLLSSPEGLVDVSYDNLPVENSFSHGVDAGDLDGDGDMDLIVITNFGAKRIEPYVLWNDGSGKFAKAGLETILDESLALFMKKGLRDRSKYATVRIADVDLDGHLDLILCASGDDPQRAENYPGMRYSRIAFGDGTGKWTRDNTIELPTNRFGYATITSNANVLDYDMDGDNDLLMSLGVNHVGQAEGTAWGGQFLQLFRNDGNRTFVDVTDSAMHAQGYDNVAVEYPTDTAIVDLDNDGDPDLVVQTSDAILPWEREKRTVKVAINNGEGQFGWADPSGGKDSTGRELAAVDADGDGDIDLVGMSLLGDNTSEDFKTYGFTLTVYDNSTIK